jgi:NAD(P)-dependent dehydrogenase (short-subunit alcohol dehydrogenase family)
VYVVITGTSRGIGLELTKYALSKGHHVLAIARKPEASSSLVELQRSNIKLELMTLDLLDKDAHNLIAKRVGSWPQVDVLINNAGIFEKDQTIEDFEKSFLTNSIKPFFITRALLPLLKKSKQPVSLQITSMMGSITDNTSGGSYSYRASKAALNILFKSFSIDEKWLISLLVHPGWVQTRMGGESAPVSVQDSAQGIWKLIDEAKLSQSGSFMTYRGQTIAW